MATDTANKWQLATRYKSLIYAYSYIYALQGVPKLTPNSSGNFTNKFLTTIIDNSGRFFQIFQGRCGTIVKVMWEY